ncbi:MAG: hypothetical protein E3J64_01300 [Anaerolineales bacterium]|nr:MAG: hypothetical protein E3J64_01300 [Anaerolineales bacterium]
MPIILGMSDSERLVETLEAGVAAAKAGQAAQARCALLDVLELDRQSEQAWLWLSSVVALPEQRRSCLESALRINPASEHARAGLAILDRQVGTAGATGEVCPRCKSGLPQAGKTCPACALLLVVACPACGQYGEATDVACPSCGNPLGDFSDGAEYHLRLARGYVKHGRQVLAEDAIKLAEAAAPGQIAVLREVAADYEALDKTDDAIAVWERVIAGDADSAEAYARLGAIYRRRSMPSEAQQMYRQAAQRSGDDAETFYQLGLLYYEDERRGAAALETLERAVQQDPHHVRANALLGDIYAQQKQERLAIEHWERAAEHAPEGSVLGRGMRRKLTKLRPTVSEHRSQGGIETVRRMGGLVLIPSLAAFMNAGLSPARITGFVWGMLALAVAGSFLWVCSIDVPRNPVMRSLFGSPGADKKWQRTVVVVPGVLMWIGSLGVILAKL